METAQEEFQIRVYLKTELAQLYAPHLDPEAFGENVFLLMILIIRVVVKKCYV